MTVRTDGRFKTGTLKGKTVNIKLYGKKENLLDIYVANLADYYLVLCGDDGDMLSSKGKTRPLVISQVFLFNMNALMSKLKDREVKIGVATSVRKADWEEAMIYPIQKNEDVILNDNQIRLITLFDGSQSSSLLGYSFLKLCDIQPAVDENGEIYEYTPQFRYNNQKNLKLHKYGKGPFCSFNISNKYNGKRGVYAFQRDHQWIYVGKTEDLGRRFNQGYGNISPRNCYDGGQQTNCRINNLIIKSFKENRKICLYFYETDDLDNLEPQLIKQLKPEWNKATSKAKHTIQGYSGKYLPLKKYLATLEGTTVKLTFEEIEKILGFTLPKSPNNHKAWWSNGGHDHSRAWTDVGWWTEEISLGNWVVFKKEEK